MPTVNKTDGWNGSDRVEFISTQTGAVNSDVVTKLSGTFSSSVTGSNNPRWRDQVRQGINATTVRNGWRQEILEHSWYSYENSVRTTLDPYGTRTPSWDTTYRHSGRIGLTFPGLPNAPQGVKTSAWNRAVARFIAECESVRSSVESGQDLAEWKQSAASLRKPMSSLQDHVLGYLYGCKKLRGKALSPKNLLKTVSDSYLEFAFGWKPLALDIGDALVGLQNLHNHPDLVPVKGHARIAYAGIDGPAGYPSGGTLKVTGSFLSKSEYSVRIKGACRSGSANGSIGMGQALQLDLPHFAPTLWNLLPYTWIVDYFTNIGDIIEAVSFQRSNITWACATTVDDTTYETKISKVEPANPDNVAFSGETKNYGLTWSGGNATTRTRVFSRFAVDPNIDLLPTFEFKYPTGSLKPYTNIAALIGQKIPWFSAMRSSGKSLWDFF